jgi:ABC-2 type transport system permease protein
MLVALVGSAFGLFLGVRVPASQLQTLFSTLVLPITFLGATYYPWESLGHVEWLKWAMVVNPLVYANETLRACIAPSIPHMNESISVPILALYGIAFSITGMKGLKKRLVL